MKGYQRILLPILLLSLLAGCAGTNSRQQVLSAGSQVEVRSYQTRTYDTDDKIRVMRAVMSTLQDLRFVIDKADDTVGVVSATKLDGYALSISVSVRPNGDQMIVRANAQFNLRAIEEPGPYQDFFAALDKGLFLDNNLLESSIAESTPAAGDADKATAVASSARPAATSAYAYYGEAEAEINAGEQDLDLWARAFVEVDGDEQRRKARYIELRADELYQQNLESQPEPVRASKPALEAASDSGNRLSAAMVSAATDIGAPEPRLSGTWVSEITSDTHWVFHKPSHRRILVVFDQQGTDITAVADSVDMKISATRDGDEISFFTWPSDVSASEIKGKWKLVDGGRRLEGKWSHPHGGGKWNLTRLQ